MKIEATPEEIADLVLALQNQRNGQCDYEVVIQKCLENLQGGLDK